MLVDRTPTYKAAQTLACARPPPHSGNVTASDPSIAAAARAIAAAGRALFITGAGISADSGLPTYRGIGGLYA